MESIIQRPFSTSSASDADLIPTNIKKNIDILGVVGSLDVATPWVRPIDWPSIENPANNTIKLLVADTAYATYAFKVIVASSGTYSVDWGDGNSDTGIASDALAQHTYTVGTGTACNRGYTTFVITIIATQSITRWYIQPHSLSSNTQYHGYLDAEFGTSGLSSISGLFANTSGISVVSLLFEHCNFNATLLSCTISTSAFQGCIRLMSVDVSKLTAVTTSTSMFSSCSSLGSVDISQMTAVTTSTSMFQSCSNLRDIDIHTLINLTTINLMFQSCFSLVSINVTGLTKVSNSSAMFQSCLNLSTITGLSTFGSDATSLNAATMFSSVEIPTSLDLSNAKLTAIGCAGVSGKLNKLTSLLFHASSTFGNGTSPAAPQIDIQYCSFSDTQLNTLFGTLPTGLSGTARNIKITGCTGAATCDQTIATGLGWTVTN